MSFYEFFRDDMSMADIDWFCHDLTYPSHFHNCLEIIVCVDNECDVTVQGVKSKLYPNDVLVIHPGYTHFIEDKGDNICFILMPRFIKKYLDFTDDKRPEYDCVIKNCPTLADDIKYFKQRTDGESETCLKGYVNYVLGKCMSRMEFVPITKDKNNDLVQSIVTYVLANFREKITMERLAKEVSYNKHYLSEVINKNLKCNFTTYVNRIRLEYFIANYDKTKTIEEQLYECGFSSKQTFYRAYKSVYGKTPSLSEKWDPFGEFK